MDCSIQHVFLVFQVIFPFFLSVKFQYKQIFFLFKFYIINMQVNKFTQRHLIWVWWGLVTVLFLLQHDMYKCIIHIHLRGLDLNSRGSCNNNTTLCTNYNIIAGSLNSLSFTVKCCHDLDLPWTCLSFDGGHLLITDQDKHAYQVWGKNMPS